MRYGLGWLIRQPTRYIECVPIVGHAWASVHVGRSPIGSFGLHTGAIMAGKGYLVWWESRELGRAWRHFMVGAADELTLFTLAASSLNATNEPKVVFTTRIGR